MFRAFIKTVGIFNFILISTATAQELKSYSCNSKNFRESGVFNTYQTPEWNAALGKYVNAEFTVLKTYRKDFVSQRFLCVAKRDPMTLLPGYRCDRELKEGRFTLGAIIQVVSSFSGSNGADLELDFLPVQKNKNESSGVFQHENQRRLFRCDLTS